ncbi:MAG: alginate export family protein [Mariprofundales bacterium]
MILQLQRLCVLLVSIIMSGMVAHAATWDTSADLRERYQQFDNLNFNNAINNDSWEFDSRLFIKAKADFANGVTAYFQPQAVLIKNHTKAAGTQNFSQADLLQAYIQYDHEIVSMRVGRQQLVYGDQRLLGHLGWKDVARTFDGAKIMLHTDNFKLDVFAVHPADIIKMTPSSAVPHAESLVTWEDRQLLGIYTTYKFSDNMGIDAYFINWQHQQQAAIGKGRNLNTYGMRLFGTQNGVDSTIEAVFQSGIWATGKTQQASAFALKAGYTFNAWKTRLGIEYNFSPGDDKADLTTHKDFVFPFHTNHAHYGEMDRFSWANMQDINVSFKTSPADGLTIMANMHFLSLDQATGDWLNVVGAGSLYAGSPLYTQTEAGIETNIKLVYKVAAVPGLKLVGLYGTFNPGAAVRERIGVADVANFSYIIGQYKF